MLIYEKYLRVSLRICLGKTRLSSSFNHERVLLRKSYHHFGVQKMK